MRFRTTGPNKADLISLALLLHMSACSRPDEIFLDTYLATGRSNKALRLAWHTGMDKASDPFLKTERQKSGGFCDIYPKSGRKHISCACKDRQSHFGCCVVAGEWNCFDKVISCLQTGPRCYLCDVYDRKSWT
jgi:hypothetical protein